ncbi:unnamed protein product, partial [Cladocopium goreaui]
DPEELVSHAGSTPHDLAKDGDDKKVFVALLTGKDCECLWLQDRTIRQLKEEAQQKLDLTMNLIGPNMEPLDEEKMLPEENIVPGTTLTVVAVNQAAEDEKEAAECDHEILDAAQLGKVGAVRHLLRTVPGAVAETESGSGYSALHVAAGEGHVEICRLLLAAGAEVDARGDESGNTPLHFATYNGQVEVVKLLLEAKASVTVKDLQGQTPLDDARRQGHDEVVKILENAA